MIENFIVNLKNKNMKNIFLLAGVIICFHFTTQAQTITADADSNFTPIKDQAYYIKKSKSQKTTAWVFLSGGVVLMGTGLLIGNRESSSFDDAATGVIIGGIGFLSALGSIPFFVASGASKRKARLFVSSQPSGFGIPSKNGEEITGLTLSIPLGKK